MENFQLNQEREQEITSNEELEIINTEFTNLVNLYAQKRAINHGLPSIEDQMLKFDSLYRSIKIKLKKEDIKEDLNKLKGIFNLLKDKLD